MLPLSHLVYCNVIYISIFIITGGLYYILYIVLIIVKDFKKLWNFFDFISTIQIGYYTSLNDNILMDQNY